MRKDLLKALERVFEAEIYGRLPFQSRASIYQRLCDDGYLQPMIREIGGEFPTTLMGYQLTHAGRLVYCVSAGETTNEASMKGETK